MVSPMRRQVDVVDGGSRLRLQTIVRLRWFAIGGQTASIAFVTWGLGYALPMGPCLSLIALSAWLNVYLRLSFPARTRLDSALAMTVLAYDVLQLAALLYFTGGIENPFTFLIVAPVTVSAASLPPKSTFLLGSVATLATALLVFVHRPLPWVAGEVFALPLIYKLGVLASVLAGLVFLTLYAHRLTKEARQMSAALAATEHVLAREQRLHALDGLAAAAAHELGTPLSTITLVTRELEREIAADIALLRSQALRCREILQKLTRTPAERDPLHARLSVKQLIDEAVTPYLNRGKAVRITAEAGASAEAGAALEPEGERRPGVIYGLGNLIENASEFANSRVDITANWDEREVTIVIADDGPGFQPDVMEALGEPYVTTRPAASDREEIEDGHGLGLGFFIAKSLLERSGAAITFSNKTAPEQGAVVRISWPRATFDRGEPEQTDARTVPARKVGI
jgi:two-component system, sensor histidine kinase RegB